MTLKMEEDQDLDEFLINFDELVRQLKVTGAEIKDEDVVCNLLIAMPKQFETVITILENLPSEQLTLSVVKSKLRAEVERRKAAGIGTHQLEETKAAAFSSEGDGCYFCGKKSHFKRGEHLSSKGQHSSSRGQQKL
ncbi:hypothetical protein ILUMI_10724 [Ignelater luminosus]|uniref:Retrovirus-related Pol polyprotein from transposon TNT 1-94 n=1 Tax=Ignelater luminosus TaxID=2038154 RepID=A0A8K0GB74_IGNLU|nr:hypothetical protein ILUMI_10724 [Ignelater luminosus]